MRVRSLAREIVTRLSAARGRAGPHPPRWRRSGRVLLVPALSAVLVGGQLGLVGATTGAAATTTAAVAKTVTTAKTAATAGTVKPNPANELDCNGWSKTYKTVRALGGDLCTDPIKVVNGYGSRFIDNGWYVGTTSPASSSSPRRRARATR